MNMHLFLRTVFIVSAFLLPCINSMAEGMSNVIRIWKSDSKSEYFLLSSNPVVSFTKDCLVFNAEKVTLTYPLQSCVKFTFEEYDVNAGVDGVDMTDSPLFDFSGKGFSVHGVKPYTEITVFDIQGKKVFTGTSDVNGFLSVKDICQNGVYIVKFNNSSFKIAIK